MRFGRSFNPSTGLIVILTQAEVMAGLLIGVFQSLDWVNRYSDLCDFLGCTPGDMIVSIPRLG